jgi:hypothetical protein
MVSEQFHNEGFCRNRAHNMTDFTLSRSGATKGGVTPWIREDEIVQWKQVVMTQGRLSQVSHHNLRQKSLGLGSEPGYTGTCNKALWNQVVDQGAIPHSLQKTSTMQVCCIVIMFSFSLNTKRVARLGLQQAMKSWCVGCLGWKVWQPRPSVVFFGSSYQQKNNASSG